MRILALDTSGRTGTLALTVDDELVEERAVNPVRGHGGPLLGELERLLSANGLTVQQIDLFAGVTGPGSFTGVRVGLSTINALSWTLGKPACGVGSLRALAMNVAAEDGVLISPVVDARKREVYAAAFRWVGGQLEELIPATVLSASDWVARLGEPAVFVGSGVAEYPDIFDTAADDHVIHAASVARLAYRAWALDPTQLPLARPRYIRPSEAEVKFGLAPAHDPLAGV